MRTRSLGLTVGLLVALIAAGSCRKPTVKPAERVSSLQRFSGTVQVGPADARQVARTDIRNWSIGGGVKLDALALPLAGLMIVELRGGEMVTVIAGQREQRREGDFWTVAAGVPMAVETGDDTATFRTIVVETNPVP